MVLQLGQVTESMQVNATAIEVNTADAQLGSVMRDLANLPLVSSGGGRNALVLVFTQPGVTPGPGGPFISNGQRARQNNYVFDGADSNDMTIPAPESVNVVSPNALAEFRLVTGARKAEYGRNSGAVVLVTPKSGGNAFHGIVSETFRNTKLNAVPFFQKSAPGGTPQTFMNGLPRKPQFNLNDFDADLGGPIRKDRTFFFASYLGFRRRQGIARSATVPSDAERTAIEALGLPEAKALLALVPRASVDNLLFSSPKGSLNRDQGLVKLDHHFSPANRFSVTYFIEDSDDVRPFESSNVPGFGARDQIRTQNWVFTDTHSFSPSLFHELRAAVHGLSAFQFQPQNRTPLASLGLGKIVPDDPVFDGPPFVVMQGFSSFGNTTFGPGHRTTRTWQLLDNVTWTQGRHIWKFGGDVRWFKLDGDGVTFATGQIVIDGSATASGLVPQIPGLRPVLNDFANGFATQFRQGNLGDGNYRSRSFNLFVQDDWKIGAHLTLNLGVRWEFTGGLTRLADELLALRRGQQSTVYPDAPVGLVYPGDPGVSRSTYGEDFNNVAPRFGFAWDLLQNGRVSLRGGYGLFYDLPNLGLNSMGPPFAISPTTRSTDYSNPWQGSRVNPIPQPFPFTPPRPGGRFDFTKIAPIGFMGIDADFETPYGQEWNLQLQAQLRQNWLLEAGYVGSSGVKLYNQRQANPGIPGPGATAGNLNLRRVLNQNNPQNALYGGAVFGSILQFHTESNFNYHSLQMNVTRRFSAGFQMTHAYTWAHAIDDTSDMFGNAPTTGGPSNRGNSAYDFRHVYSGTYVYQFPWHKNQTSVLSHLVGGWGVSGFTTIRGGAVADVADPADRCLCDSGSQRPDYTEVKIQYLDPKSATAVPGRPNSWFDGTGGGSPTGAPNPYFRRIGSASSFAQGAGSFGNLDRFALRGPGFHN
jgi:hypothetical protein